ncbi:diacylglycerol/lipid kinase family protein [Natronomonas sp. EA1]|uniref:diacylglycerol/lipid kinase family protein n=1 Tax=Natronomonas sp. EA1 TaxID=3421655 RepID=UPI003EBCFA38
MRVMVRNPNSGDREKSKRAKAIAERKGIEVWESTKRGETLTLAREAGEAGAELVYSCGGDGTLNEVGRGLDEADALPATDIAVVPAGTGNNFADNIGIKGIDHAFRIVNETAPRRLDLGTVKDNGHRVFINSCVGGLTAESSAKTTPAMKKRLGVMAYVLQTLAETRRFDGLKLDVRAGEKGERVWTGEAIMLLVGNGRRFPGERMKQANMEDGLMNVVIIEQRPALDYLSRGAADKLLRRGASHLTRVKVPRLDVTHDGEPVTFSLDGELVERNTLTARSRKGAMSVYVGERYDPEPEEWGKSKAP